MESKSYAAFLCKKFGFTICSDFPWMGERAVVAIDVERIKVRQTKGTEVG